MAKKSKLEAKFAQLIDPLVHEEVIPQPEREYHFLLPVRRFRADFAWPDWKLVVEIQGGIWKRGRHGRGTGIVNDYERVNEAAIQGWTVLQFDSSLLRSGEAMKTLARYLVAKDYVDREAITNVLPELGKHLS